MEAFVVEQQLHFCNCLSLSLTFEFNGGEGASLYIFCAFCIFYGMIHNLVEQ